MILAISGKFYTSELPMYVFSMVCMNAIYSDIWSLVLTDLIQKHVTMHHSLWQLSAKYSNEAAKRQWEIIIMVYEAKRKSNNVIMKPIKSIDIIVISKVCNVPHATETH